MIDLLLQWQDFCITLDGATKRYLKPQEGWNQSGSRASTHSERTIGSRTDDLNVGGGDYPTAAVVGYAGEMVFSLGGDFIIVKKIEVELRLNCWPKVAVATCCF